METSILALIPESLHVELFAEVVAKLENAGELPRGTVYTKAKPQEVSQDMKDYLAQKKASKK